MIDNLFDYGLSVVAGAVALVSLFDGTRRLGAYGVHPKAALMTLLAAGVCALYGTSAYQKYADLSATLSLAERNAAPARTVANWTRGTSPERREALSAAVARETFKESGTLRSYVDRNGQTRVFSPTQEDLQGRERVIAYYSRTGFAARASLAEALLWLIMSVVAVLLGFLLSFEKPPAQAHAAP
jgi:hypothetical protein